MVETNKGVRISTGRLKLFKAKRKWKVMNIVFEGGTFLVLVTTISLFVLCMHYGISALYYYIHAMCNTVVVLQICIIIVSLFALFEVCNG